MPTAILKPASVPAGPFAERQRRGTEGVFPRPFVMSDGDPRWAAVRIQAVLVTRCDR